MHKDELDFEPSSWITVNGRHFPVDEEGNVHRSVQGKTYAFTKGGETQTFLYNNKRCHAEQVKALAGGETYVGEQGGYEIYEVDPHQLFDQWGFVAVKKQKSNK